MSANGQLVQTRNFFREYLSKYPLKPTFEEWNNAAPDHKACLLYVTFFQQVTLAWYNAIASRDIAYVSQEDAVSTVLQYFMKNVPLIEANPALYNERYIYRVCYNCIGCLPRSVTEKTRSESEMSNEYSENGPLGTVSLDLCDLIPSDADDPETHQIKEAIWTIIEHMGVKAEKVVNHIINPSDSLHRIAQSSPERPFDRLADVSVSNAEYESIIEELRVKLAPYQDFLLHF